jgi:hypothetical protein
VPYITKSGRIQPSRSIGHVPIADNPAIKDRLGSFRIFAPRSSGPVDSSLLLDAETLAIPREMVRWVMSFDGSPQEVAVREEYPSSRVGFVQIAGVLVNLEQMLGQSRQIFVDPAIIKATITESLYSLVLPGSNVCRSDVASVRDSWRVEVYDTFCGYRVEDLSLLDIFMSLVDVSDKNCGGGRVLLSRCSADDSCPARDLEVPRDGRPCPNCGGALYPTDALRFHEEVLEEHPNLTSLGRLMLCLEHLIMVGYAQFLFQRQPRVLGGVAFVMDGPLAIFGPQAWLHGAILAFYHSLVNSLSAHSYRGPVVIGIEKSGQFAEHAASISDRIPRRNVMLLPDSYIFQRILTSRPTPGATYGRDTYYGQKFFYKTAQDKLLTMTIPKPDGIVPDPHSPQHYPELAKALLLLDRIGTSLYENALIPIALAHSFASIPLRTGTKVLTLLSQQSIGPATGGSGSPADGSGNRSR